MKKKRFGLLMSVVLAAGTLLSGCGASEEGEGTNEQGSKGKNEFSVGMVTDTGGVDDKSFNQSAWEGLQRFGKEFGLEKGDGYDYLQSNAATDYAPNLNRMVRNGYDLVYGIGFLLTSDIVKVAQQQKDAKLALIDSVAAGKDGKPLENVASITFKEHQGSFLVGVVAGLHTKSNKIGFVGGVTSDLIKKFENGFKAGVKTVNPDAEIIVQYAEDFNDASKGAAIASTMYETGADIIYHAAGGTGNGVFTEAKNRKANGQDVWVIGVDRDQHEEGMPENVTLTSMVKRVDNAVYQVSKMTMNGNFPGGKITTFGLEDNGVGIAPTTENVSEEALKAVEDYKQKIIDGEITVPKTDEEYKKFLNQ